MTTFDLIQRLNKEVKKEIDTKDFTNPFTKSYLQGKLDLINLAIKIGNQEIDEFEDTIIRYGEGLDDLIDIKNVKVDSKPEDVEPF